MPDTQDIEVKLELRDYLNYNGGITYDSDTQNLTLRCKNKDILKEISYIRKLALSLNGLAEHLEGNGIDCNNFLPSDKDSDPHGNVEWLRSGIWMRGSVSDGQPIDATRWRSILPRP